MTRATIALIAALAGACSPGPLPDIAAKVAIDSGPGRFPSQSRDPQPLDKAIYENRLDEARELLARGADPNARWGEGDRFPLQEVFDRATYPITNRVEYVRALLAHGADPDMRWCPFETRGGSGGGPSCTSAAAITVLHFAALFDDRESVELLLNAGANPMVPDWVGSTALQYAYDEVVFEMISRAMFPDLATRDSKALAWISDHGGFPYGEWPWGATAISRAIAGSEGMHLGSPPPPPPPSTAASLRLAQENRYADSVWLRRRSLGRLRTLLRIGADPNQRINLYDFDWSPLALALSGDHYRTAELLLQNKADINSRWCTVSAFQNHQQVGVKLDAACTEATGRTALMWSAERGDALAVTLLLDFAADVSLKDWAGQSAADLAKTDEVRTLIHERR